jgi:hypothetical protein
VTVTSTPYRKAPPIMSKLAVGNWVRCERDAPSKGTWPRYVGRVGRAVIFNSGAGEWGVRFTAGTDEPTTWFLPSELVVVERPAGSPSIRVEADRERRRVRTARQDAAMGAS